MSTPLFSNRYWADDEQDFMNDEPTIAELIELESEMLDEMERQWYVDQEREYDEAHGYSISSYDESADDYFESLRNGHVSSMSMSDAERYYSHPPMALGTKHFWNPKPAKTIQQTTREGYNKNITDHVEQNKKLLESFLASGI